MRLVIEKGALQKALSHVQRVVERRNTIPILSNVLIDASDGGVTFAATDLDIEIVDGAEAAVSQRGSITAPAHTLYEIVRKLPDGSEVAFELDGEDGRLTVRAGRSKFVLPVLGATDFPTMSVGAFETEITLERAALARLIDRTGFAISTEETRYYLNGVYLHMARNDAGPCLRAVATDGHRLALADHPMPASEKPMPGVIVPRKTVQELRKLLDDASEDVSVAISEAKIRFSTGRTTLTSKLIDGTYPEYSRVIPQNNSKVMTVRNEAFKAAVDRVATMAAERTKTVRLSLEQDKLGLQVSHPEYGAGNEELDAVYSDDPIEIAFNARYLLDITQQINSKDTELVLNDSASPVLVRDTGDPNALFVLMPLRV